MATAGPNIKAAVQAQGDAGDANKKITFGTPGSKVQPGYIGAEARDTGQIWTPDEFMDELVTAIGAEMDKVQQGGFSGNPAGAAATTIGVGGFVSYVKVAGTTNGQLLQDFTHTPNNRLTYIGAATRTFLVTVNASITSNTASNTFRLYIYKNGAATVWGVDGSLNLTSDIIQAGPIVGLVELAQNDYLELYISANVASNLTCIWRNMVIS